MTVMCSVENRTKKTRAQIKPWAVRRYGCLDQYVYIYIHTHKDRGLQSFCLPPMANWLLQALCFPVFGSALPYTMVTPVCGKHSQILRHPVYGNAFPYIGGTSVCGNAFPSTRAHHYMWMYSHILGYPSICECIPIFTAVPHYLGMHSHTLG